MGAITVVPAVTATVEPGERTSVDITVRNTGSVVDSFAIEPLGPAAEWTVAEPDLVRLLPGEDASVRLVFSPPRHFSTPNGPLHWAVRARSSEDPDGSVVDEGMLDVASFADVQAELAPRTSRARGRRAGKHQLAIDNLSNRPVQLRLAAVDEAEKLRYEFKTSEVVLEPGAAQVVPLKVRATKRFWRGQPVTHPFTVLLDEDGGESRTTDGALLQETVLPAWLLKALLIAAALLAALGLLWATVLKPTIEDVAQSVAAEQAAETAQAVAAKEAASAAGAAVAPLEKAVEELSGKDVEVPTAPPVTEPPVEVQPVNAPDGTPLSVRLAATETQQSPSAVLSEDFAVRVTDLLLQNPQGDSGIVTIKHGDSVVYVSRLDNFRDLDLHLVAPVTVQPDATFTLEVACENQALTPAGAPARPCTPALTLNGFVQDETVLGPDALAAP